MICVVFVDPEMTIGPFNLTDFFTVVVVVVDDPRTSGPRGESFLNPAAALTDASDGKRKAIPRLSDNNDVTERRSVQCLRVITVCLSGKRGEMDHTYVLLAF